MIKYLSRLFRERLGVGSRELGARANGTPCSSHHKEAPTPSTFPLLPQLPAPSSQLQRLPLDLRTSTQSIPFQVSGFRSHPWPVRLLAGFLSLLLFLTSSPPLLAITMGTTGGSATGTAGRGAASNLQNAGAASAAMTAALARKSIERSDTAVGAMRAMQLSAAAAAKAAARSGTPLLPNGQTVNGSAVIPNGLAVNWLHPHDGFEGNDPTKPLTTSWKGASINAEKTGLQSSGDHNVEITQSEQNAYLYWKDFNVGPKTTINFDQSKGGADAGKWIAFNKITGTASPSSVYGKIQAQGQVYVLNQNGIMFHNGSEVNVHALVASTLPINGHLAGDYDPRIDKDLQLVGRGIANNADRQFLFSALEMKPATAVSGSSKFVPRVDTILKNDGSSVAGQGAWINESGKLMSSQDFPVTDGKAVFGNVWVERGAAISVGGANSSSGLLLLSAPSVINEGTLSAPEGQIILASGLQVGVAAHNPNDPSLRGLDVTIGKVLAQLDSPGIIIQNPGDRFASPLGRDYGTAWQGGLILAPRGNLTMAGADVSHQGVTFATTSVSLNGRVDLLANYGAERNLDYNVAGGQGEALLYRASGLVRLGSFEDESGKKLGSVISIIPEWDSDALIEGTQLAINSIVSVMGGNISMGGDSMIWAPGALSSKFANGTTLSQIGSALTSGVTLAAGTWHDFGNEAANRSTPSLRAPFFLNDSGGIHLAEGSVIDVAGSTGVKVDGSQNYLKVQLRGSELANSPLQRNSPVRGKDITVDIRISGENDGQYWVGTPLGDVTGYLGLIRRSVGELTINGGSINLSSGEYISLGMGSILNASGGWKEFSGGNFNLSRILYRNQPLPIWQATPDRIYEGITTDSIITEKSYLEGGNGGLISLKAASMGLDGQLQGLTVVGARQLRVMPNALSSRPPARSGLEIRLGAMLYSPRATQDGVSGTKYALNVSPYAPNVRFESGSAVSLPGFSIDSKLPDSRRGLLNMSPAAIREAGFGNLVVDSHDGAVILPTGSVLNLGVRGSLKITASRIDLQGAILTPAGSVSLSAVTLPYDLLQEYLLPDSQRPDLSPLYLFLHGTAGSLIGFGDASLPTVDQLQFYDAIGLKTGKLKNIPLSDLTLSDSGLISMGPGALIDVSGKGIDDFWGIQELPLVATTGGTVSLSARDLSLGAGIIDVSGGYHIPSGTKNTRFGNAGSVLLHGTSDPDAPTLRGGITLGVNLKGYAGFSPLTASGTPGSLDIKAPAIRIANGTQIDGALGLSPLFFNKGGFGTFLLSGIGIAGESEDGSPATPGVEISQNTLIQPSIMRYLLKRGNGSMIREYFAPSGNLGHAASLSFSSTGLTDSKLTEAKQFLFRGVVKLGWQSGILLDPKIHSLATEPKASLPSLSINMQQDSDSAIKNSVTVILGDLVAPGGNIRIGGSDKYPENNHLSPKATVDLGPESDIRADGIALYTSDPTGLRQRYGMLVDAGNISISGAIVGRKGSTISANGTSAVFDDLASVGPGRLDGSGGGIALKGGDLLLVDSLLSAKAGGNTQLGGSLSISSSRFFQEGVSSPIRQVNDPSNLLSDEETIAQRLSLRIFSSGSALGSEFQDLPGDKSVVGVASRGNGAIADNGGGAIAVERFSGGGFDQLDFTGNLLIEGNVTLKSGNLIRIASGDGGFFTSGGILKVPGELTVDAPYVALGMSFESPLNPQSDQEKFRAETAVFGNQVKNENYAPPVWGAGSVKINSTKAMDLGNLSFQRVGNVQITTPGTIRGNGTMAVAGNLIMKAAQMESVSDASFRAVVFDHASDGSVVESVAAGDLPPGVTGGSITLLGGGSAQKPLSAGGSISLNARNITLGDPLDTSLGGVISAPFGSVALGSDGSSSTIDPVSGIRAPYTQSLILNTGSRVSVSGAGLDVNYGTSSDGTIWLAPSSKDITAEGTPEKSILLEGADLSMMASLDLSGGGKLSAIRWISGLGGKINILGSPVGDWNKVSKYAAGDLVRYNGQTWSARSDSENVQPSVGLYWSRLPERYAIIPGFTGSIAPTGYGEGYLGVGSQIWLRPGEGFSGGSFVLLPAAYATQPGSYLVTLESSSRDTQMPLSFRQEDGSLLLSGSYHNPMSSLRGIPGDTMSFSLANATMVASMGEYNRLDADKFFSGSGSALGNLPGDAGKLSFNALSDLSLGGSVSGLASSGRYGARIDVSVKDKAISVGGNKEIVTGAGGIWIDPSLLVNTSSGPWTFDSLLLGGVRADASAGRATLTATASSISIADGVTIKAIDMILASRGGIKMGEGVTISAGLSPKGVLDQKIEVSGNGSFVRVSADVGVAIERLDTTFSPIPGIVFGQDDPERVTSLLGMGVILDTTSHASSFASDLLIGHSARGIDSPVTGSITINSGLLTLIGTDFQNPDIEGSPRYNISGPIISGVLMKSLQGAKSLRLQSYGELDLYGSTVSMNQGADTEGMFGNKDMLLTLSAAKISGQGMGGGSFAFRASEVNLGNRLNGSAVSGSLGTDGIFEINASRILTGNHDLMLEGFSAVSLLALDAMVVQGSKQGTSSPTLQVGDPLAGATHLYLSTPLLTGDSGSSLSIKTSGDLILQATGLDSSPVVIQPGLVSSISLEGDSVSLWSKVILPSGSLSVTSRNDLLIGSEIDVSGGTAGSSDSPKSLSAGSISLGSQDGEVHLLDGAILKLDAAPGARAGTLSLSAIANADPDLGFEGGGIRIAPSAVISAMSGSGREPDLGGTLDIDVATAPLTSAFAGIGSDGSPITFSDRGFTRSLALRARGGDLTVDDVGFIKASSVTLTADRGSISILGGSGIDASGRFGGAITLQASGSIRLDPNSYLSVHGDKFDSSGAGGKIFLSAGVSTWREGVFGHDPDAVIDLKGSYLDLGITATPDRVDQRGGILHIRVPRLGGDDITWHDLAVADHGLDMILDPEGSVFNEDGSERYSVRQVTAELGEYATLASISAALGRSVADMAAVNGLTSDGLLIFSKIQVGNSVHTVMSADTVASLALKYGVTEQSIREANGFLEGTGLRQGIELRSHVGASAVVLEGYRSYDLATDGQVGVINAEGQDFRKIAQTDAELFFGTAGSDSEAMSATLGRVVSGNDARVNSLLVVAPGVEIVNTSTPDSINPGSGDLTLRQQLTGSSSMVRNAGDWDFSQFRVGAKSSPGFLTLRSAGNILLESSLSDGFQSSHNTADLSAYNDKLPSSFQSWSYRLVAGADFSSVSGGAFVKGSSSEIGLGSRTKSPFVYPGLDQKTTDAIAGGFEDARYYNYQVIRTGTGSIDLFSSGRINLRNNLASIYTAGAVDPDQTLSGRFDLPAPNLSMGATAKGILGEQQGNPYKPQFSQSGGSISLEAGTDILRTSIDKNGVEVADSTRQLPSHWLYRRGSVDPESGKYEQLSPTEVASTSWWVDFSNFFQGVGALGGGNVSLSASENIENVDAVIPTMMRTKARDLRPDGSAGPLLQVDQSAFHETGGGNIQIKTGGDLSGGSYYVERGTAQLIIGGGVVSNATRDPSGFGVVTASEPSKSLVFLPTTFFVGKGIISLDAVGDTTIGAVANPFLTPQGINNGYRYRTYFSTFDDSSQMNATVLSGNLNMRTMVLSPDTGAVVSNLWWWMKLMSGVADSPNIRTSFYQPWTRLSEDNLPDQLQAQMLLLPSKVSLLSLSGDLRLSGDMILNPSSAGSLELYANGSVIGMNPIGYSQATDPTKPAPPDRWYSSTINVSDAAPAYLPSVEKPLSFRSLLSGNSKNDEAEYFSGKNAAKGLKVADLAKSISDSLSESGSYKGEYASQARQLRLHDKDFLDTRSVDPIRISAYNGGITGLVLYSPKKSILEAAKDIGDVGLYLQNISTSDQSIIRAGGSVNLWSQTTASQIEARAAQKAAIGNGYSGETVPTQSGDVRISGPGSLLIQAGGSIDLGNGPYNSSDGTGDGITSIGNSRNPHLPFLGADIDLIAGLADLQPSKVSALFSLASGSPLAQSYFKQVLESLSQGGLTDWKSRTQTLGSFMAIRDSGETASFKEKVAITLFQIMLKQSGRDYNDPKAADYKTYRMGEKAVETLLGANGTSGGNITTWSRDIRTKNGGSISITAPGGGITLANTAASLIPLEPFSKQGSPSGGKALALPPGIVTASGGGINIYTDRSVDLGIGRIFTLRGGDIMIWSDKGDIAAGSSAKTVASAPPTRVLVDPQSASVLTDLAGLATGGGIGVLAAIPGVPVGNVDLIAPSGVIDAGDAGIRSTGNLNLAATKILNADNILAGGVTVGAPPPAAPSAPPPAAPPPAAPPAGSTAAAAAGNSAAESAASRNDRNDQGDQQPSIFSIDILGYGGGDDDEKKAADASVAPVQAAL